MKQESVNLDVLRSFAVMSVLFAHLWQFFGDSKPLGNIELSHHFGSFGVILFFVHTSLVLMFSMDRQIHQYGRKNWILLFYMRRAFRIYPLSMFAVATVFLFNLPLAGILPYHFKPPDLDALQVFGNLFLFQNFFRDSNIIGPLWTLPIEIQMYLVLPFIWLLLNKTKRSVWLLIAYAFVSILILFLDPVLSRINQSWLYYQIPNIWQYAPCFFPGILAYAIYKKTTKPTIPWWILPVTLMVLSIVNLKTYNIGFNFIICLTVGVLLPYLTEPSNRGVRWLSQQIAKYSYGIYLLHFFAMYLCFETIKAPIAVQSVGFVTFLALICFLAFHLIEKPMIGFGKKWATKLLSEK